MSGGSVLIVEDEKDVLDVMAEMVMLFGYSVKTLDDGAAALEEIPRANYDLVITDLGLPGVGGAELVRKIRAEGVSTPVLIVTGVEYVKAELGLGIMGGIKFLQKPFKIDDLKVAMSKALGVRTRRTSRKDKIQTR